MASSSDTSWLTELRGRFRPPRTLSFTRAGKFFVLMTLGVGFGAINTGNNLLFLLLGMTLSLIIASGLLSEAVLRRLDARRRLPKRLVAGRPAPGGFELINPKSFQSLSIEVVEQNPTGEVGPMAGEEIGPGHIPWWMFWKGESDEERPDRVAGGYCVRVDADDKTDLDARYTFPARGVYELPGLSVVTRFPFSFFEKARDIDRPARVVVYPEPAEAPDWSGAVYGAFGETPSDEQGRGEEYYGLREYRPGEDKRLIHWKQSASRGDLVIKEHEKMSNRSVTLHVYNATGRPARQRHRVAPAFETGLEQVAGLIEEFDRLGWDVTLRTLDGSVAESDGTGDSFLRCLARLPLRDETPGADFDGTAPEDAADVLVALPGAAERIDRDWDLILPMESATGEATQEATTDA
jgi:uncharacterized protein (DUF58 family)